MKTKLRFFLLLALCAVTLYGRFAQSTIAVRASMTAKGQPVLSVDKTLDEGLAALKSEHFDQAIKAAKQVLSASSDSNARIKAYQLLITSVRSSDGYAAAIRRCESVYSFAKNNKASNKEITSVRSLLADLRQHRSQYLRTIAEQQRIIRLDKDRAAAASLKLASCKQALGPREEATKAYEDVVKNYPLTRPGWKALEELAWMRQPKGTVSAAKPSDPVSTCLSDGLQALKEGRLSEAEKTARTLLSCSDAATRSGALILLIEALAKSSGSKIAAKQAWQMACGTKEFKPAYSDVLRLEAIVADLIDEPIKANETVAKKDEKQQPVQLASAKTETGEIPEYTSTPVEEQKDRPNTGGTYAAAVPQQGGFPRGRTWPGVSVGSSKPKQTTSPKTSTPVTSPTPSPTQPSPVQPTPPSSPTPVTPTPVVPAPGNPIVPTPVQPELPFDQWTCSKEYEKAGDDLDNVRSLVEEHIDKAQILIRDEVRERRGLGVVLGAAMCASDKLDDIDLALSICDDYVLRHIKAAKPESYRYLSRQLVLDRVILIWIKGGKDDKAIETLSQTLLEDPVGTNADSIRMRLAQVYEKDKKYQEAIDALQEIDDKGDLAGAKQYIPELEKKLRGEQQ